MTNLCIFSPHRFGGSGDANHWGGTWLDNAVRVLGYYLFKIVVPAWHGLCYFASVKKSGVLFSGLLGTEEKEMFTEALPGSLKADAATDVQSGEQVAAAAAPSERKET